MRWGVCAAAIALLWTGAASAQWCGVRVEPAVVEFDTVPIGASLQREIWVFNDGDELLQLHAVALLVGPWVQHWRVDTAAVVLPPGQMHRVRVEVSVRHNVQLVGVVALRLECPKARWSVAVPVRLVGVDPESLYAATQNRWGEPLRQVLRQSLQQQRVLPYDSARQMVFLRLDNRDGTVECLYTGQRVRVPPMPPPTVFNIEHAWPRSRGTDTLPPLSDLHHLFPTLAEANERRSNLPYGIVAGQPEWQLGGSKLGRDSSGQLVFEVRPVSRGNVARALFALAVRYGNLTGFLTAQQEALLRRWHEEDPVDSLESARTRMIAQLQGRANPFVERPQLLERLFRVGGNADFPAIARPLLSDTLLELPAEQLPWTVRLWVVNTGFDTARLRALELVNPPPHGWMEVLALDSLIAPGEAGALTLRVGMDAESSDTLRVRLRFAAGVRPLEVRLLPRRASTVRLQAAWAVEGEFVRIRLPDIAAPQGWGELYTVLGTRLLRQQLQRTAQGWELALLRTGLSRGVFLYRVQVGQWQQWGWILNP
jgi:deoxyribonuclease-1